MSNRERSSKARLRRKHIYYQIENNINDRGRKGMKSFLFYRHVPSMRKGDIFDSIGNMLSLMET
jgi:hypothetical protein